MANQDEASMKEARSKTLVAYRDILLRVANARIVKEPEMLGIVRNAVAKGSKMRERIFCLPERYERNMYYDMKASIERRRKASMTAAGKAQIGLRKKSKMSASRASSMESSVLNSTIETTILQDNNLTKLTRQ